MQKEIIEDSSQQAARNLRSPIRIFLFFCSLTPLQASGNALAGIQAERKNKGKKERKKLSKNYE
jgi:hypothetical protein